MSNEQRKIAAARKGWGGCGYDPTLPRFGSEISRGRLQVINRDKNRRLMSAATALLKANGIDRRGNPLVSTRLVGKRASVR